MRIDRRTVALVPLAVVLALAFSALASAQTGVFFITGNRAGVGTSTPTAPLEVVGASGTIGLGNAVIRLVNNNPLAFQLDDTRVGGATFWNIAVDEVADEFRFNKAGAASVRMTLTGAGDMKVAGNFFAGGVQLNVPDYVFDDDYRLMPLGELASFIERERHLPDIPTAEAIQESGLNMTEMQMKLLQKIEELTLYTLAQQRSIEALEAELEALRD